MKAKQIEYGLIGLIIGLLVGAILGLAELNWIKKSQRATVAIPLIAITAAIVSIVGIYMGSNHGKLKFIKQRTGLDNIITEYIKDGRYWIGISTWIDKREWQEFKIETQRLNGILCSAINGQVFRIHSIPNANQQTVPKIHAEIVTEVSRKIIDCFEEGKPQMLNL